MNKNKSKAGMIDVSAKSITQRWALATGQIQMSSQAFAIMRDQSCPKGNVIETARVAGLMAAKKTADMIPCCHPLELNHVHLSFNLDQASSNVTIQAEISYSGRTGVEMEALLAVSVAALTIYDMLKGTDPGMLISEVKLLEKKGGASGDYSRAEKVRNPKK